MSRRTPSKIKQASTALSPIRASGSLTGHGTLAVVGLGYVGLPLALLAARKGYQVIGYDIDATKTESANTAWETAVETDSPVGELRAPFGDLVATTDHRTLANADVIVVCVPTPVYGNHLPNLEPLKAASRSVGSALRRGQLVVLESTVNPNVTESLMLPLLEAHSRLRAGTDFSLAHCPERINPGDPRWDVENIPRVVGGFDAESLARAKSFYESILLGTVMPMSSIKEAEAVKIVENAFRDINIAFVNELAMSFTRLGIDVTKVLRGASTKPFAFIAHSPGCGVGGHCIPVDPYYLIEFAKENGFRHKFLELAREINEEMPRFTVEQLIRALGETHQPVFGTRVTVLGLAYKADIEDCRESPSFKIIDHLKEYGADVQTFDPFVGKYSTAQSLDEALRGAQAVVVATDHTAFRSLTPRDFLGYGVSVVVDGRNCLPKDQFVASGIRYRGIGR